MDIFQAFLGPIVKPLKYYFFWNFVTKDVVAIQNGVATVFVAIYLFILIFQETKIAL